MKSISISKHRDSSTSVVEVTLKADPKYKGNLDELRKHPLYAGLRQGQRVFLDTYLQSGNKLAAAHASQQLANDYNAAVVANRYLNNWRIRYLLCEFYGNPITEDGGRISKREMEFLMTQRLRSGEISDALFADLSYQMFLLKGWVRPQAKSEPPRIERRAEMVDALEDRKTYFRRVKELEEKERVDAAVEEYLERSDTRS